MTYCFRIRCTLGATVTIASDDPHWVLATRDIHGEDVVLAAADGTTLRETRDLVVRGSPFDSAEDATAAGQRWMSNIQLAFARMKIGADFGGRGTPGGIWTNAGLRMLEARHGGRLLNDVMGLSVFECEPAPRFMRTGAASASVGKGSAGVLRALRAAAASDVTMTAQEQLAYALYSASFNETHADARFVMLMMALETLLPETERPEAVLAHIEHLSEVTKQADLPEDHRRSLLGSLQWLRLQSINQTGRQLARTLGDRTYMGGESGGPESATKFFTRCYEMRSALVHGHYPRPTREEVGLRAAHLENFLGDLLAGELRDVDPHPGAAQ